MKTKIIFSILVCALASLFIYAEEEEAGSAIAPIEPVETPTHLEDDTTYIPETVLAQKTEEKIVEESQPVTTNIIQEYPRELNPGHALLRGFVNTFTCWLDVPRSLVLDVNKYPFFGLVTGTLKGGFFMGSRAVLSVTDFAMLGFTGPSLYDPVFFPEYVWNAQWRPYEKPSPEEEQIEEQFEEKDAIIENMENPVF